MRVNLDQVAKEAGVSKTTVSRALGNNGSVAAATKQKIYAAIDRLGYTKSTLLKKTAAELIAVCVPASPEHWQLEVCRMVMHSLQREGLVVATPFLTPDHIHSCIQAGARAVVTPTFSPLGLDIPTIRFAEATVEKSVHSGENRGNYPEETRTVPETIAARMDLTGGLSLAFGHLKDLGHRRIGLVCNDSGVLAELLAERFFAEHPQRGLTERLPEWVARVPKSYSGGIEAAAKIRDATCTAVIVQSALQLHGVLAAMRLRRLQVPRDLSVVGFGDSSTLRYAWSPATVLTMGTLGLSDALLAGVRSALDLPGKRLPSVAPTFRMQLVVRKSTAAVRS